MIPSEEAHLRSSTFSHPGKGGKDNEDRFALSAYQLSERDPRPSLFAVIADGRGEQRAGEVAAQTAVDIISRGVAQSDASQPSAILHAAIIQAGQSILAQSENDAEKRGMGSTCLCVWVIGNRLYTASLGNSRLFLLRQRRLQQVNVVHDLRSEKEEEASTDEDQASQETPEELRGYLGSRMRAAADFRLVLRPGGEAKAERNQGTRLQANDRLLLCTDGLSDALSQDEIAELLGNLEIEDAAEALVHRALDKNAQDNLSAIVLGLPPARPNSLVRRSGLRPVVLILFSSLLLVLLSLLGSFFFGQRIDPSYTLAPSPVNTLTPLPSSKAE